MLKVEVLGTGCPKCKKLYDETKGAIARSGVAADLAKINQIDEITKRGVMVTPALVIDGEVRRGKVCTRCLRGGKLTKPGRSKTPAA